MGGLRDNNNRSEYMIYNYGWTDDPTPPHEWVEMIVYT